MMFQCSTLFRVPGIRVPIEIPNFTHSPNTLWPRPTSAKGSSLACVNEGHRDILDGRFTRFAQENHGKSYGLTNFNHQQMGISWEWCLPSGNSTVCYGNPSDSPIKHGDCPYAHMLQPVLQGSERQWLMIHELELESTMYNRSSWVKLTRKTHGETVKPWHDL